jgi:predicted dehydrogenase
VAGRGTGTISVGVIGIGFGQQVHVPALRSDLRCHVQAICASQVDRARKVADRLGIPDAYGDADSLIADPGIDAIAIAVPPARQAALIEAAAAAGKHVFCEKPLADNLASATKAYDAVQHANVRHAIDLLFPEIPAWQEAKSLLQQQKLGQLRHAAVSWRVETYAYRAAIDSWKTRSSDGGGTLNSFVSHSAHYIEWLLGRIARVSARLRPPPGKDRAEARVDAWLELESGLPVTLSVAADAPLGSGHRVEIYGDLGALVLSNTGSDYVNGFELWMGNREHGRLVPMVEAVTSGVDGRVTAAAGIVRRFVDAIIHGGQVIPGLAEGVRVQTVLDAMRSSDSNGVWQDV